MITTTKVLTALILFGSYLRHLLTRHPSHRLAEDQTEQQRLSQAFLLRRASFTSPLVCLVPPRLSSVLLFFFFVIASHLPVFLFPARLVGSRQGCPGL